MAEGKPGGLNHLASMSRTLRRHCERHEELANVGRPFGAAGRPRLCGGCAATDPEATISPREGGSIGSSAGGKREGAPELRLTQAGDSLR